MRRQPGAIRHSEAIESESKIYRSEHQRLKFLFFFFKRKMERIILIRNRSARSIRNTLGYINQDDFFNQTINGLKGRLEHLKSIGKIL